jgi:hypothetical protein
LKKHNAESNGATTDAIGASRDPKNPPFCKIAFFFLREIDFFVSALCAKGNISTHKDGKHSERPYEKQMFHKI